MAVMAVVVGAVVVVMGLAVVLVVVVGAGVPKNPPWFDVAPLERRSKLNVPLCRNKLSPGGKW